MAHLDLRWAAVTLDGRRHLAVARPPDEPPRMSAFVTRLDLHAIAGNGERDAALGLVLPCWTLLGMLDRAMELTQAHVLTREQFGQRLAAFQGVQFQLTEAEVVFRVAHQLHGAIGFCDEAPLSWLSRYSQPLRRLPSGLSATRAALTGRIGRHGLTGLFGAEVTR